MWDGTSSRLVVPNGSDGGMVLAVSDEGDKPVLTVESVLPGGQWLYGSMSPDGKRYVSVVRTTKGDSCWLWDLQSREKREIVNVKLMHAPPPWSHNSPHFALALAGGDDVGIFDGVTGSLVRQIPGAGKGICDCTFTPDGSTLITTADDAIFRFWDVRNGNKRGVLYMLPQNHWLMVSPDGHWDGSPGVEDTGYFWYDVYETGKEANKRMPPKDFADRFKDKWENDRKKVNLLGRATPYP
jgi:WD40 repeat protein